MSTSYLVVPGFSLITSFHKTNSQFGGFGSGIFVLSLKILSGLKLIVLFEKS